MKYLALLLLITTGCSHNDEIPAPSTTEKEDVR